MQMNKKGWKSGKHGFKNWIYPETTILNFFTIRLIEELTCFMTESFKIVSIGAKWTINSFVKPTLVIKSSRFKKIRIRCSTLQKKVIFESLMLKFGFYTFFAPLTVFQNPRLPRLRHCIRTPASPVGPEKCLLIFASFLKREMCFSKNYQALLYLSNR